MTQRQSQVRVLSMRKFADVCRTTPRTLRFYDQKGLLKPIKVDEWTGYRYYAPKQARDFLRIRFAQSFDLPLRSIRDARKNESIDDLIRGRIAFLKQDLEEKKKKIDFLERMNSLLFDPQTLDKDFKRESVGPFNIFSLKIHGDYSDISKYRLEIREEAKKLKLGIDEKDLVIYLDSKYHPKNTPLEISVICKSQTKPSKLPDDYSFRSFPKTSVLSYSYQGPESFLILVYQRLFDILIENKVKLKGYAFDLNMQNAEAKISEFDNKIKLCFPI